MAKVEASLPQFERFVVERNHEQSLLSAVAILEAINVRYGRIDRVAVGGNDPILSPEDAAQAFCTRFAAAFGRMIVDPDFNLSARGYEALLAQHRWLDLIFSISGFRGSDHLLPLLGEKESDGNWRYGGNRLLRLLAIRSIDSRSPFDFDQFWQAGNTAAALALTHYLDSACVISGRGLDLRERILEWLPERIDEVKFGPLSLINVQNAYMHCSYAFTPGKHAIKAGLIRQMRRACIDAGCKEYSSDKENTPSERPTIVVVLERFGRDHSVYRTHWLALKSLRAKFNVVWVGYSRQVEAEFRGEYDELLPIPDGEFFAGIRSLTEQILQRKPVIVFHVGVGMSSVVVALASLRLAPVQCVSFGHTATTMSPAIDHMILPEDFVGARECFSEQLVTLPKAAMPFMPPVHSVRKTLLRRDGPIRIAVVASAMKLNARLIEVFGRISATAKSKPEFHFFPAFAVGIVHQELARVIGRSLPNAIVHAESPRPEFYERLAGCDLFLCPFPYGNMNGIIDAISLGLPGVCLDGPEAHAHADSAHFARAGFPPELTTKTVDEYVAAAVRLIDDQTWRAKCARAARACDLDRAFYKGDASLFCWALVDLVRRPAETAARDLRERA